MEIPYASVESYESAKDVTRHLRVLPRDCGGARQDAAAQPLLQHLLPHRNQKPRRSSFSRCPRICRALSRPSRRLALPAPVSPISPPSIHINCGLSHASSAGHCRNCPKRGTSGNPSALRCPHEKSTDYRSLVDDFGVAADISGDRANGRSAGCRRTPQRGRGRALPVHNCGRCLYRLKGIRSGDHQHKRRDNCRSASTPYTRPSWTSEPAVNGVSTGLFRHVDAVTKRPPCRDRRSRRFWSGCGFRSQTDRRRARNAHLRSLGRAAGCSLRLHDPFVSRSQPLSSRSLALQRG